MIKDQRLRVIEDGHAMTRRLTRREMVQRMLAGMGAGAAWPLVAASHPIHRLLSNGRHSPTRRRRWRPRIGKPLFLSAPQNEALVALSEMIVAHDQPRLR